MISSFVAHIPFIWLVTASLIAGVMNAMAGGGSFLSFPAMLAVGVLPIQANATNTVALWPGQITSVWALRTDVRREMVGSILCAAILGGATGAIVLLHTGQLTFMHLVPWLLLGAAVLFGISGRVSRWLRMRSAEPHQARTPSVLLLFLALLPVCFYIGYFGAGGGFLVMAVLGILGVEEMHHLNALKVMAAMFSNLSAVVTFVAGGAIVWRYCVVSMVFAGLGGYVGAQYARRMNPNVLRTFVVIIGFAMAAFFFWRQ